MSFAKGVDWSDTDRTPVVRLGNLYAGGKAQLFSNAACSSPLSSQVSTSASTKDLSTSILPRGDNKIYARAWDKNGNPSSCTKNPITFSFVVRPPELALQGGSSSYTDNTPTVKLTRLHKGGRAQIFADSSCAQPLSPRQKNPSSSLNIDTNPLLPGRHRIYAKAWDEQGDASPCSKQSVVFAYVVRAPTLALTGSTYTNTPTIRASNTYPNGKVQLFSDSTCTKIHTSQQNTSARIKDFPQKPLSPGSYTFYAKSWDGDGYPSLCGGRLVFNYAVKTPTLKLLGASSSHSDNTPTIRVSNLYSGLKVQLFSDSSCTNALSGQQITSGATRDIGTNPLKLGNHNIYAKAWDKKTNASSCAGVINYSYLLAPPILTLTGGSFSESDNTPNVKITNLHAGGKVQLFFDSSCTQALSSKQTTTGSKKNINTNPFVPGVYKIYAKAWNKENISSSCSAASPFTYSIKIPTLSLSGSASSHTNNTPTVQLGNLYSKGKVQLFSDSSCMQALSSKQTTTGSTKNINTNPFVPGIYKIYAKIWNVNDHASECKGTLSYAYSIPEPTLSFVGSSSSYTDDTPAIRVGNTYPNGKVQLFSDSFCLNTLSSQKSTTEKTTNVDTNFLSPGIHQIYVKVWNNNNHPSICKGVLSYAYSILAPVLSFVGSSSSYTDNTPAIRLTNLYIGGHAQLFSDSSCTKSLSSKQSTPTTSINIDTNPLSISIQKHKIYAKSWSFQGDASPCSTPLTYSYGKMVIDIFLTQGAYAALKNDGSVVTWGYEGSGGEKAIYDYKWITIVSRKEVKRTGSSVASQLTSGVKKIFSTSGAFAALKSDDSVVTWGSSRYGGDSSSVASKLTSGVTKIFSTDSAFAALKSDGSVVTWGGSGGDSSSVASKLTSGVSEVFSNKDAFAALKSDGSVVTWGKYTNGGDSSSVASKLTSGVTKIFSKYGAFAALKSDGSVVTWGWSGGDSNSVASKLTSGVTKIFSNKYAFAALKSDGSVVTWGGGYSAGSSEVASKLTSGVTKIFSNTDAFAALKKDGSVVVWGASDSGAYTTTGGVCTPLDTPRKVGLHYHHYYYYQCQENSSKLASGVSQIFSTDGAFAALKNDGSVVTWGAPESGGGSCIYSYSPGDCRSGKDHYCKSIASKLTSGVEQIFSTDLAFAALKNDGSVVTWGNAHSGGNASVPVVTSTSWCSSSHSYSSMASQLTSGVSKIFSGTETFVALKEDGTVVTWGPGEDLIVSDAIAKQLAPSTASTTTPQPQSGDPIPLVQAQNAPTTFGKFTNTWNSWFGTPPGTIPTVSQQNAPPPSPTPTSLPSSSSSKVSDNKAEEPEKREPNPKERKPAAPIAKVNIGTGIIRIAATPAAFAALKVDGRLLIWGEMVEEYDTWKILTDVVSVSAKGDTLNVLKKDGATLVVNSRPREEQEPRENNAGTLTNTLGTLALNGTTAKFAAGEEYTLPPEIAGELFLQATEGESANVIVSLDKPLPQNLTVSYSVENITTTDEDWQTEEGVREMVIPSGSTFAIFTIEAVADDEDDEENEQLRVLLEAVGPEEVAIGTASAVVTVVEEEDSDAQ